MTNKIDGILLKHQKNSPTFEQQVKALAFINGKYVLPSVKLKFKNPRRKPSLINRPVHYQLNEKELQRKIIIYLRLNGCVCGKIKTQGSFLNGRRLKDDYLFLGVPDILCFNKKTKKMWWIEVKFGKNKIKEGGEQDIFRKLCLDCNIGHIQAHSLTDVLLITEEV